MTDTTDPAGSVEILSREEIEGELDLDGPAAAEHINRLEATIEALHDALVLSERARAIPHCTCPAGLPESPCTSCMADADADTATDDLRPKGWCPDD